MDKKTQLDDQLQKLPLEVGKVGLWLVFRGLRPMASLVLDFNFGEDQTKEKALLNWLDGAGVYYFVSQKFANTLHVAKDKKLLELNHQYELDESQQAHAIRGQLYGFPEAAVTIYAQEIIKSDPFASGKLIHAPLVDELRGAYWYPYIEYLLRVGHEIEDSQVAKRWADVTRAEIPQVVAEYEESNFRAMEDLRRQLLKNLTES